MDKKTEEKIINQSQKVFVKKYQTLKKECHDLDTLFSISAVDSKILAFVYFTLKNCISRTEKQMQDKINDFKLEIDEALEELEKRGKGKSHGSKAKYTMARRIFKNQLRSLEKRNYYNSQRVQKEMIQNE